jgi:drug/metabolite transporter (DMT)-like permease
MRERKDHSKTEQATVQHTPENGPATFSIPHTAFLRTWSTRTKAYVALAMVCFFWGTTWLASKEGVRHMPALQMAGIRQTMGGLCYVLYFAAKGRVWPRGREWRIILMLGILNFTLTNGLSTWGVKYISAGLGSIISAIVPLWLVLINMAGAQRRLQPKMVVGVLLGFAGICVIFYEHLHDFLNPQFRFGILLSLAATWSWAFGTIYTKKHATGFNPYFSMGLQMLLSGLLLTALTYATGDRIPIAAIPWQSWGAMTYLVLFGSLVGFITFVYALQHLTTEQSSIYSYVNPIVAVFLGWILFGEILTPFIIAGVLLTLYGVYLVNRAGRTTDEKL